MAAVAPQASTSTSYSPPTSAHGGATSWNFSVPAHSENVNPKMGDHSNRPPLSHPNGQSLNHSSSRTDLAHKRSETFNSTRSADSGHLAPARVNALARKDSNISDAGSAPDSLLDLYGTGKSGMSSVDLNERKPLGEVVADEEEDPERSRWIHRDKLARIENQELQAAGIILPRARAASKTGRKEHSRDQQSNGVRSEQAGQKRQRIGSSPTEEQENVNWDLRTPEEVAEVEEQGEFYSDVSGGVKGVSRIPVSKSSPLPIPQVHLERHTPMRRIPGEWTAEDGGISNPKSRSRRASINILEDAAVTPTPAKKQPPMTSPTKKPAPRKTSTPGTRVTSAPRPKTRSGGAPVTRDVSGQQRPTTRSGELTSSNSVKRPEGDPPWLSSRFKPDPRLPPDQQLLPTVARRLQQEQWEKEGKFGTAYDTAFRPLNDEEFGERPLSTATIPPEIVEKKLEIPDHGSEWPLKGPKSPALSTGRPGTSGGYSTIPKITEKPQRMAPPISPQTEPIRLPEPPEEDTSKKGGCGCFTIM